MPKKSFLTCPHKNVQQFTEYCLDCGYNIWTTEKQYKKDLKRKIREQKKIPKNIRDLEKILGIEP